MWVFITRTWSWITSNFGIGFIKSVKQNWLERLKHYKADHGAQCTHRSLLAHLYCVLVHMGRHRLTPPVWTVRKWSGHSQVCSRPPSRIKHRWEQPPLFTAQGLFTIKGSDSQTVATQHSCVNTGQSLFNDKMLKPPTHQWAVCTGGRHERQMVCVLC